MAALCFYSRGPASVQNKSVTCVMMWYFFVAAIGTILALFLSYKLLGAAPSSESSSASATAATVPLPSPTSAPALSSAAPSSDSSSTSALASSSSPTAAPPSSAPPRRCPVMSISAQSHTPRLRIVLPALAAAIQQPAVAVKPFAPVIETKEVELKFTISLQHASLSFDGSKKPKDKADWKPCHAIASWASWSRNEKGKVTTTSNSPFACRQAASVSCDGAAASHLQVQWLEDTASAAEITKKLKQKPGGKALEEQFIQITVFAANQGLFKAKDGCAAAPRPPTQTCDDKSKPIVLGAPFLLNLSELVSIDCEGHFFEDEKPKTRSISLEDSSNKLSFKSICQRVKPAARPPAPAPTPVLAHATAFAGGGSASIAFAPDAGILGRTEVVGTAVKPARFPQICSFSVVQLQAPIKDVHFIGSHVRICSDDPLLCIGTEFEICDPDASDCFGKIVACSSAALTSVYTVDVEVFRHVVYLPCSPKRVGDVLSEMFHVFVENRHNSKRHQLDAEISRGTAAAAKSRDTECADARQRILDAIVAQKHRAKTLASARVRITLNQLGMVQLRQGFMASQQLISDIVKLLIKHWHPGDFEERCEKEFHCKDGPWDVFAVFAFLLRRRTFSNLVKSFGFESSERDNDRQELVRMLKDVYYVRNWWAHVSVSASNCRQALVSLQHFIDKAPAIFKPAEADGVCEQLKRIVCSFDQTSAALPMTVDDIAYFYFGRASRHVSQLCELAMQQSPDALFSVCLKHRMDAKNPMFRQKGVIEAVDVTRALIHLNQTNRNHPAIIIDEEDLRFYCETIRTARNNFAHAADSGNRVIMVLLALGSLSRVTFLVSSMCAVDAASAAAVQSILAFAANHKSQIDDWQAELLERAGMVDIKLLIDAVCDGHVNELKRCEYEPWATDNYRRLRLLTTGHVLGDRQAPSNADEVAKKLSKELRTLLNVAARVPPSSRDSATSAANWLLSHVKEVDGSAQNDHMKELISSVQKAVSQDAAVQIGFTRPCSIDATDRSRAAVVSLLNASGGKLWPLVEETLGTTPISEWDALLQASSIVFNSNTWIHVPCTSNPEMSFRFHSCVMGSAKHQRYTAVQLLAHCSKALHPLLNLSQADTSPDGVLKIEMSLGAAGFFDALSHLAVLASAHLHSTLELSDRRFDVEMVDEGTTGLSAAIASQGILAGRQEEIERLNVLIRPVFNLSNNDKHCPLILIHGQPGTGKSFLADYAVSRLENEFKANEGEGRGCTVLEEYSYKIQARDRAAVRDGLHRLGLTICDKLGLGSSASVEDVLGSDSKPQRLLRFLRNQRFVIVADDCDVEGCNELLLHIPQSTQPCALVLTSWHASGVFPRLTDSIWNKDLVCIPLDCFQPQVSLQLVDAVCGHDYSSLRTQMLLDWTTQVLDQLGHLPLAVRLFAGWLRQELSQAMLQEVAVNVKDLQSRWAREYADEEDDCAGVLGLVIGNRGLRATVLLVLHHLESHDDYEACKQLLGLLSLCPPLHVPWSLFDGVSIVSALDQACKVCREDGSGCAVFDDAVVASDEVIQGGESVVVRLQDGSKKVVALRSISFGSHIIGMIAKDERYRVQLLTPQPYMRGARVELHSFVKTVTNNGMLGRVIKMHADDTVSVVFGCETGVCCPLATPASSFCNICAGPVSALKPGAEVKRFKAGNVRVRGVEGMAVRLQEVEGLKRVAAVLRCSGLVQVDEVKRTFGMHQLLQQALGRKLKWSEQCERMRRLLEARCGKFGDDSVFDTGLYGMRLEVFEAAVTAAMQVKAADGETGEAWCSGMLLQLLNHSSYVATTSRTEFIDRVFAAAHGSVVGDLVCELVMKKGCTSEGRRMTLQELVHAAPHVLEVIERHRLDAEQILGHAVEEIRKGSAIESVFDMKAAMRSRTSFTFSMRVRAFDLTKCLDQQWGQATRASLLAGLVRAYVTENGGSAMQMQDMVAVPLFQDVAGSGDVLQMLRGVRGVRVVEDGGGGCRVEVVGGAGAVGRDNGEADRTGLALKAMRWRLFNLMGNEECDEKIMREIGRWCDADAKKEGGWELGVALGAIYYRAGHHPNVQEAWDKKIAAYERALRIHLVVLGEQDPVTAETLSSMGAVYAKKGDHDMAIMLFERALRIYEDIFGPHPHTAYTMSSMGGSYCAKGQHKEARKLLKQALLIYDRTVGRMNRYAADVMVNMSTVFFKLRDFAKAEKLGLEALNICEKTLGRDHDQTGRARKHLGTIQGRAVGLVVVPSL